MNARPFGAQARRLTVVAGPPGAGKTTYALKHMRRGDLLIDHDRIFAALTGLPTYDRPDNLWPIVRYTLAVLRRQALRSSIRTWIVGGFPRPSDRAVYLAPPWNARVIVLTSSPEICMQRIRSQERPEPDRWDAAVREWFSRYRPTSHDETVQSADTHATRQTPHGEWRS